MKFLIDAQLPPSLADFLHARGHEAVHVHPLGLATEDDSVVWEHARQAGATILTKDEDFLDRSILAKASVPVVLIRGNCSNRALERWLEPLLPDLVARLQAGERLIELR